MIEKPPEATTTRSSEEEKSDKLNFQWHVKVAAILITCAQSFSNNKHEVNCGRATVHGRPPVARAKQNSVSGAVTLEVFPMGKSLELGSLWVLIDHFHICGHIAINYARKNLNSITVCTNGIERHSWEWWQRPESIWHGTIRLSFRECSSPLRTRSSFKRFLYCGSKVLGVVVLCWSEKPHVGFPPALSEDFLPRYRFCRPNRGVSREVDWGGEIKE